MFFSGHFAITRTEADDWFDPDLERDTLLFVDPLLIWADEDPTWRSHHQRAISFFNEVLKLVAQSWKATDGPTWRQAERLMIFREPLEFCLGFGRNTIHGSGAGEQLRDAMLDAAVAALQRGITEVSHFEELVLFGNGVGADRISDIVCNVLKAEFIEYTQQVASRHQLPLERVPVRHRRWDDVYLRWIDERANLPRNPFEVRPTGVLLVPERFLRELPTLDPAEFWSWAWVNMNVQIREDFGNDIRRNVDSQTIMTFARRHSSAVARFTAEREQHPPLPYDFGRDPRYLRRWWADSHDLFLSLAATPPESAADLCQFVFELCTHFKHQVEHRGSWRLLWDGDVHRRESMCQSLFDTFCYRSATDRDVDVSPEANGGSGPVDFKFSRGAQRKAVVELKLAGSSSLRRNAERQVPTYMQAESTTCAVLVVVQFRDAECEQDFVDEIDAWVARVAAERGASYSVVWVDARPKQSASKR